MYSALVAYEYLNAPCGDERLPGGVRTSLPRAIPKMKNAPNIKNDENDELRLLR